MLIGLCGPRFSGKSAVAAFLVNELDFILIDSASLLKSSIQISRVNDRDHSLSSTKVIAECWKTNVNVVIDHINPSDSLIPELLKRPYFLLIYVDAPLFTRFSRYSSSISKDSSLSYEKVFFKFAQADDQSRYRYHPSKLPDGLIAEQHCKSITSSVSIEDSTKYTGERPRSLYDLEHMARLRICNNYENQDDFFQALRALDVTDRERLRPGWDAYFMSLARLAADRTNCMKRRVGCVIARDRRMVASGYNGTPSGVTNCSDGGCARCNGTATQAKALDLCLCLHAEENAIIEAGRDRCKKATLYTNVFPCILCAKKIVQSCIARVVFENHYATDDASEQLLRAGGVIVDRFQRNDICDIHRARFVADL